MQSVSNESEFVVDDDAQHAAALGWKTEDDPSSPSYSYRSTELAAVFVYGDDMERQQKNFFAQYLSYHSQQLNFALLLLGAAILCYLRRRQGLRRDGYISCFIDMIAVFFGGGNIRISHRYERWFFGIIFIPVVFIMAIWGATVFYPCFFELDRSIKSIEEVSAINPPIFISPTLKEDEKEVVFRLG